MRLKTSRDSAIGIIMGSNGCPFKSKLYTCLYCPSHYVTMRELMSHNIKTHEVLSEDIIRKAIRIITQCQPVKINMPNYNCKLCKKEIYSFENLKTHLIDRHGKKIDPINQGVLPFKIINDEFSCALCVKKFDQFKTLNSHLNEHYANFVCDICGNRFASELRLKGHAIWHNVGEYPCVSCGKVFKTRSGLRGHTKSVHMKEKRNKCTLCAESFRDYNQKQKHMLVAHGVQIRKYKCKYCEREFLLSSNCRKHEKEIHLKSKAYTCDMCDYICFSRTSIISHLACHTDEKIYKCEVCEKSYTRSKTLTEHVKRQHKDRKFVCDYCNKIFVHTWSWKEHLKTHIKRADQALDKSMLRRIVPLFQVAYDRTLCRPLGTIKDFSKLARLRNIPPTLTSIEKIYTPSGSASPVSMEARSPSPFREVTPLESDAIITPKPKQKNSDVRQNALTIFEHSTVYPFIYGNNKFKCFICSQPFLETGLLRVHMNEAHTFAPLKRLVNNRRENILKVDVSEIACKICSTHLPGLAELKTHLKLDHGKSIDPDLKDNIIPFKLEATDGGYKCVICHENFIKVRILVIHMSVHFNNYSCEVCGSGFMTLRLLKKHLEVHESGNFPCDRCSKIFSTAYKRTLHIRGVHMKQYLRRCPMCPERFNSNYKRTIHLQDVHNQSTRVHKCETCGRAFNLKYHLICHTRSVHLQERNQQCDVCHQRFCNKETLKRHMVIHTGEKNYKCEVCGMAFLRRKNLKDHLRLHEVG